MKVALIYDRVNKWGGAERVLLALHEIFPDAPLFTSVYDIEKAPWAKVFPKIIPSFLQNIPVLRNYHEMLGWLTPIAYETFNFDEYNLVISITSEAAKGIITKPGTYHICYCLTPTRYLWSGFKEYINNPPKVLSWIPFYKHLSQPFLKYAKKWDKIAAKRPDCYIAISGTVQKRIKKYYKRESDIIYPPVEINKFKNQKLNILNIKRSFNTKKYYLLVSRLVPYKKVDLAIKAFNELGYRLVIVGTGTEESYLRKIAKDNIEFRGFVDEEKLVELYQGAEAFIHPQEEDFGITAVEAQAAGVPVIAYKKGGVLDTVIENKTGVFFEKQTTTSLQKAITRFETLCFDKKLLIKNAQKFSKERFKKEFEKIYIKV
jgi:glycosyltransferase involved in cell wall biosynthesis